jgi:hypothetical protein
MIELQWQEKPEWMVSGKVGWLTTVPAKDDFLTGGKMGSYEIIIEPRPPYCDRGEYLVKVFSDGIDVLDCQEGFPRYFFSLEAAKSEMEAWVNKRQTCLLAAQFHSKINA